MKKTAILLVAIVLLAVGVLPPASSFAVSGREASDIGAADASVSVPGMDESGAGAGAGYDKKTKKYYPSTLYSADIKVLVKAKILKKSVYKTSFSEYITAAEMNKILRSLHRFLGGDSAIEPVTVIDSQVTGEDGVAVSATERGEALSSLAVAVMNAKPDEWASLREPLFEFLAKNAESSANGTVAPAVINMAELEKDGGIAQIPQTVPGISREDTFSLVSRMVWQFEPEKMVKATPVPEVPEVLNAQGEEFYNRDVYLYWVPVNNAAKYIVRIYDGNGDIKKKIMVSEPVLNLTDDSPLSFGSVFGKKVKDYPSSFTVQAVSAHGLTSKQTDPVSFTALRYASAAERYGTHYINYKDGKEGKKHQTAVTLYVWRDSGGERIPATVTFSVNSAVAESVVQIFGEYFNGKEHFPIQSIGGFAVRPKRSEHNYGTAIDINPNENYMVGPGGVTAGNYWDPEKSEYSIAPDSELVKAFERHGWYWAGNGWGNTYDYMHFSYMGT